MRHFIRQHQQHSITFLLLLMVLYTGWLLQQSNQQPHGATVNPQHPDAFIEHAIVINLDEQGRPHSTLKAPRVVHYPLDDTSLVDNPYFIVYSEDQEPWHTSADRAKSQHGKDKITLWDNVKIHQPSGPNNKNLTMTTTSLTIYPARDYAETDEPVELTEPGVVVNAIGMHAYLKEKRVELLSKARGVKDGTQG